MTMGEIIQTGRARRGLSQEKLAELVGVSRQAVSKWEVGDTVPDTDKLVPLARALHISTDELLGNVPGKEPDDAPPGPAGWKPSFFDTHWYWLGLIPLGWGSYRLYGWVMSFLNIVDLLKAHQALLSSGFSGGAELDGFFGPSGEILYGMVVRSGLAALLLAGGAVLAGVLMIVLGRRYVKQKYGRAAVK